MPSLFQAAREWLKRKSSDPAESGSAAEALSIAALVAAAAGIVWYTNRTFVPLAHQVVLWGFLLLAAGILFRRALVRFFGPVFFYDLVRLSRRGRYAFLRSVYALLLLLIMTMIYQQYARYDQGQAQMPAKEAAAFAGTYFYTFMWIQILAVGLLTPAYTAGAIAEEKDRRTLEFVLATDLRSREIVFGKQASRVVNLAMLMLTGMPLLSMLQLMGGVDPDLVLVGFAATFLTLVSLASVSILASVYSRRARDAIVLTYLVCLLYLGGSGALYLLGPTTVWTMPIPFTGFTVADVVDWVSSGNIIASYVKLTFRVAPVMGGGAHMADVLPELVTEYAIFHALVIVGCTGWAMARLRPVATRQPEVKKGTKRGRVRRKPVSDRPMFWKEVVLESGFRLNAFGRVSILLLFTLSLIPITMIICYNKDEVAATLFHGGGTSPAYETFREMTNVITRWLGTVVACLAWLAVVVRASSCITVEKDKQTWDSLLTSPLTTPEILAAKWLGSIWSVRWMVVWMAVLWAPVYVLGAVSELGLVLTTVAWFVIAGFFAMVGMWFSLFSKTTLRANLGAVTAAILISFGHWAVRLIIIMPVLMFGNNPGPADWGIYFETFALTPPITVGWLPFRWVELTNNYMSEHAVQYTLYAMIGVAIWAVLTLLLWIKLQQEFRRTTNRGVMVRQLPPAGLERNGSSQASPAAVGETPG